MREKGSIKKGQEFGLFVHDVMHVLMVIKIEKSNLKVF